MKRTTLAILSIVLAGGLALTGAAAVNDTPVPILGAETPAESDGAAADGEARTERFDGTEHTRLGATAPWPTCPTTCRMTYNFDSSGDLRFSIDEGADRVEVRATWEATTPSTEELYVMLAKRTTEWDGCDDPDAWCGRGVGGETGASEITFTVEDPEAGEYGVSASPSDPVAVTYDQDVNFEVLVHYIG